jgi:SAM-dependent methyltransferase
MTSPKTNWEPEHSAHFDEIVHLYDRVRHEYPDEMFADIFGYINSADKIKALEIGAGTGKATFPFLKAGFSVTAVEVGAKMAEFLSGKFKDYTDFEVIISAFEDAVLEENNYDLVYAACSFHWVNPEIGVPKVRGLLKPGGVFALMRSNGAPADGDPLYEEIQAVYERHYNSFYKSAKRPVKDEYGTSAQILRRFGFGGLEGYGFKDISMKLYDVSYTHNADGYIALLETLSDHRHLPDENRNALYAGIKAAINRHGGYYKPDLTFQLYMGRKM